MRRVAAALALWLIAAPAAADVRDFLGRTIVDVRVEVGGALSFDESVLQLFETRIGEPFAMRQVRESIDHLVGLGRFEDVQVFAEAGGPRGEGVIVRWVLVPVQRIARIEFEGRTIFPDDVLRGVLVDRTGAEPVTSRVPELIQELAAYYAARGYRQPRIEPRLAAGSSVELVTLSLHVEAGPRSTIRGAQLTGDPGADAAVVLDRLGLRQGAPFDPQTANQRAEAYAEDLREDGFYEADVEITPTFAENETLVDVSVNVERGAQVRVVFAGDPLPQNRREALVPIRRERSVDLDLLEDASRNIESFLRQDGYRAAEASYVREDRGGEMVLTFTVKRGPRHRLASLDVSGAEAVSPAEIAPLLALKPGEPYSDGRVATVAAAVTELYRVRGYARATIKPEVRVLAPERPGQELPVAVQLLVVEGPQTLIGEVTIAGATVLDDSQLRPLLGLTTDRPFYRPQLDADRDALEHAYRNEGFQSVRVEPRTSSREDGARLDVQWTIAEGPQVIVDRILVTGNARTDPDLIRREIVLRTGSPLGADAVIESQRRLAALGLFRRVRILELPHGVSQTRDILIELEEAPPTTIGYGGGIEVGRRLRRDEQLQAEERIDVAPRGFFEVSRRNLWGKNRSLTFFTRVSLRSRDQPIGEDTADAANYGFNEYRVVGTFREPRPFDATGDLQLTGFLEQATRTSFNFRRRGMRVEYGRRLAGGLNVTGRYSLDRTRLFDTGDILPEDEVSIDRLFPQVRLSMLTGSVLRDTRNDPVDPAVGTLVGTDVSLALRGIGSQVGFVKSFSQGFVYRQLPGTPLTVVAGARLGVALGFARELDDGSVLDDVPASERFFAGGDTTVRGFVLDRLATEETLNEAGFPTGGNGLVVVNGEVRSAYWKGLSAVGFVDAGNVFRRAGDLSLGDLRPAAGVGVRYRSPLGPLRVDLGFNLDPQLLPTGARERRTVFHLSLGQAF